MTGGTKLLTLLGHPVAQAASPAMVNERLAARGVDAVMVPMDVLPTGLADALAGLSAVENWVGSVVTSPYRQSILPLLATRSRVVSLSGACNVVRPTPFGLAGDMLQGVAMCDAIERAGGEIASSTVGLVGAGGVASAVAFALAARGACKIAIRSRHLERASALASRLRVESPGTSVVVTPDVAGCDLIVNATPLGTRHSDALPVSGTAVYSTRLVADAVITTCDTPLIALAKTAGIPTVGGMDLLVAQTDLLVDSLSADEADDYGTCYAGRWQVAPSDERAAALLAV